MENMENRFIQVNWEKISVYIAICASFLTVIVYLFQIKDDISSIKERIAVLETKMSFSPTETATPIPQSHSLSQAHRRPSLPPPGLHSHSPLPGLPPLD